MLGTGVAQVAAPISPRKFSLREELVEIRDGQKEEEEEMAKSRLTSESCPYQTTYRAFFSNLVPPLTAHFPLLSLSLSLPPPLPLFPLDSFYTPSRILVLLDCPKKKTRPTSRFRSPPTKT